MDFIRQTQPREFLKVEYSVSGGDILLLDGIAHSLGSILPRAEEGLKIVVTIPVDKERSDIQKALYSFVNQKTKTGAGFNNLSFEVLVLCDNCSEGIYEKCKSFADAFPALKLHVIQLNSVTANTEGTARRILMKIAAKRLDRYNGFIISTDANTVVDENWLSQIEKYIEKEISLVCKYTSPDLQGNRGQALTYSNAKDINSSLKTLLESHLSPHTNDPCPWHNFLLGHNLSIRRDVYNAIREIWPFCFSEKVGMYYRVINNGYLVQYYLISKANNTTPAESGNIGRNNSGLRIWTIVEMMK